MNKTTAKRLGLTTKPNLTDVGVTMNQDARPIMPPPAKMLLIYAILGWDQEQNPKPGRHGWLPAFIRLVCSRDRLQQICDYALAALRGENAPIELLEAARRSFAAPGFERMLVDALAEQSIRARI